MGLKKRSVTISKKEYEGMKDTIELLQNKKYVKELIESLKTAPNDKMIKICA